MKYERFIILGLIAVIFRQQMRLTKAQEALELMEVLGRQRAEYYKIKEKYDRS